MLTATNILKRGQIIAQLTFIISLAFSITSCQDVIDPGKIGDPEFNRRLVIDALINDKSDNQEVFLTWSQPYFDNGTPTPILGATVVVNERNDSLNRDFTFTEDPTRAGHYIYSGFRAQEKTTYSVTIINAGETYKAQSYCPRRILWVQTVGIDRDPLKGRYDSLFFKFRKRLGPNPTDSGYQVQLRIADTPGFGDNYRLLSYRNGRQLNRPFNLNVYQDNIGLDGRNFIVPALSRLNPSAPDTLFKQFETITVEVQCINVQSYQYWLQVGEQITNGGLFASPPANVPCNLINIRTDGPRPLGWFGSATTLSRTARIERGVNVEIIP